MQRELLMDRTFLATSDFLQICITLAIFVWNSSQGNFLTQPGRRKKWCFYWDFTTNVASCCFAYYFTQDNLLMCFENKKLIVTKTVSSDVDRFRELLSLRNFYIDSKTVDSSATKIRVITVGNDDRTMTWNFILSKVQRGTQNPCWMTDAIIIEDTMWVSSSNMCKVSYTYSEYFRVILPYICHSIFVYPSNMYNKLGEPKGTPKNKFSYVVPNNDGEYLQETHIFWCFII